MPSLVVIAVVALLHCAEPAGQSLSLLSCPTAVARSKGKQPPRDGTKTALRGVSPASHLPPGRLPWLCVLDSDADSTPSALTVTCFFSSPTSLVAKLLRTCQKSHPSRERSSHHSYSSLWRLGECPMHARLVVLHAHRAVHSLSHSLLHGPMPLPQCMLRHAPAAPAPNKEWHRRLTRPGVSDQLCSLVQPRTDATKVRCAQATRLQLSLRALFVKGPNRARRTSHSSLLRT